MADSKNVYEAELELARGVRKIDEQTWEADNCASALAWLRCYLYWPTGVAAKMQRDGGVEIRMQQRVFFRGHANAHWRPTPRLLRFEGEAVHRATVAGKLAASIVNVEFEMLWSADGTQNWPPLVENTGYAAIQHYCIPTSLLDWTAIPSVAVHFATCSEDSKNSPMAAVLWLEVANAGTRPQDNLATRLCLTSL